VERKEVESVAIVSIEHRSCGVAVEEMLKISRQTNADWRKSAGWFCALTYGNYCDCMGWDPRV